MSVLSAQSRTARRTNRAQSSQNDENQTSEYDGFWLNVTLPMGEGDNVKHARFPAPVRGIAIADLKTRKVYENMDPEYATQVHAMNAVIEALQEKCLTANNGKPMEEGQTIEVGLSVVLYRRQEESAAPVDPEITTNVKNILFGG